MKELIVHVGPYKTGTSAIQKWCLENQELLSVNGIYYPEHTSDGNHISSGQVFELLDLNENKNGWLFNAKKSTDFISKVSGLGFEKVLISSEMFCEFMCEIQSIFDNITFVLYLRDPLERVESEYNQTVKRHGQTDLFNDYVNKRLSIDSTMLSFCERFLNKEKRSSVIIRSYDAAEHDGDVVADFASTLGIKNLVIKKVITNSSYNVKSLEFKRRCNIINLSAQESSKLDQILQKDECEKNETIFSHENYKKHSQESYSKINDITSRFNFDSSEIIDLWSLNWNNRVFVDQNISLTEIDQIIESVRTQDEQLAFKLNESRGSIFLSECTRNDKLSHVSYKKTCDFLDSNYLEPKDIHISRDLALYFEGISPKLSKILMEYANSIHPEGDFIRNRLNKYLELSNDNK